MTDKSKKALPATKTATVNEKSLLAQGTFNCFSNGSLFATGFGAGVFAFEGSSSIRRKAYNTYNPARGAQQKYKKAEFPERANTEVKKHAHLTGEIQITGPNESAF